MTSVLRERDGDVVGADVEVDGAGAGALGLAEAGPRGVKGAHAGAERIARGAERAELDRDRLIGAQGDRAMGVDVDLVERRPVRCAPALGGGDGVAYDPDG